MVVVSVDRFNRSRLGLIVACPLTRSVAAKPSNVVIEPPQANLSFRSFVLLEHVRSISIERLGPRIGRVTAATAAEIDERLRSLLGLREPRRAPSR